MEIISLLLTFVGFVISGFAYLKAKDVEKAIQNTIKKHNVDEDLQRLRELLDTMKSTKEAVSPWTSGKPEKQRTGRDQQEDLCKLNGLVDALRTRSPLEITDGLQNRIVRCASTLDEKCEQLANDIATETHWKTALAEIQDMIPRLEQCARSMKDHQASS